MDDHEFTDAEQAVIDVLTGESTCTWHVGCDVEDCYGPRARAIVAKLRLFLAADALEVEALWIDSDSTLDGERSASCAELLRGDAEHLRAAALSRPTAEETE